MKAFGSQFRRRASWKARPTDGEDRSIALTAWAESPSFAPSCSALNPAAFRASRNANTANANLLEKDHSNAGLGGLTVIPTRGAHYSGAISCTREIASSTVQDCQLSQ